MTRLRVATVITRMQDGAGAVALGGARALRPEAVEVTIVTGSGGRLLDEAAAAGLEVIVEPSLCSPIAPRDDARALCHLSALFARRRFDVVHTHSAKAGVVGRMAASHTDVAKIVHTFHGFPFHEFQSRVRREAYVQVERCLGQITDTALCVGTAVSVEAVRRGLIRPERMRTIGVPIDTGAVIRSPQTRDHARRALGLPNTALVVGMVGRVSYQKAPENFVTALELMRRLDVIGIWVGGGELAERLQERIRRALPGARIVLAGERADVPRLLPAFDVFALPSRYEGLPVAIVEAMICGIPVVATAVNSVPDVVRPGETGLLVPPQRPDLLADALGHLLDRPEEAARMAAAARAQIDDRYSAQALGNTLLDVYTAAPNRGSRQAHCGHF
ncbi:glycosyltransferase [Frankia sp. Cj3]|uniref:glycosyltransferase n=1 Tax=Frankia sp. Cj3 TaxID=2880976 RepID=UPI001EF59F14|nr:glycosyltransferase [Frankia sp. Cj3]